MAHEVRMIELMTLCSSHSPRTERSDEPMNYPLAYGLDGVIFPYTYTTRNALL